MKVFKVYLNADLCRLSCYFAYCFVYAENERQALQKVLDKYPQMKDNSDFKAVEIKDFHIEYHD